MSSIDVRGVTLDYPVYSMNAKSLRTAVLNVAIGGKLLKTTGDMTIVRALSNIQFSVKDGDRLGIVGHNGAGKTTLLKVLAGIYEPTQGVIEIKGRVSSMLSMSIGVDHEASGIQNMRNLLMQQSFTRKEAERRLPEIIEFSELGQFAQMPFKTYSAGMMARLTFAVATAFDADVLLMDEWISAGDGNFKEKAAKRMDEVVGNAGLVVLATHSIELVQRVCNKVMVLNGGRMEFIGSLEEWQAQSEAA
jgi:lipopolysaccharide transport system ATP-binding protein